MVWKIMGKCSFSKFEICRVVNCILEHILTKLLKQAPEVKLYFFFLIE